MNWNEMTSNQKDKFKTKHGLNQDGASVERIGEIYE